MNLEKRFTLPGDHQRHPPPPPRHLRRAAPPPLPPMDPQPLKKPKTELNPDADDAGLADEQEEALVALIAHRTMEVEHAKKKLAFYNAQMEEAVRKLSDSESKLARLRSRHQPTNGAMHVKSERRSPSPAPSLAPVRAERYSPSPAPRPNQTHAVQVKAERRSASPAPVRTNDVQVKAERRSPSPIAVRGSQSSRPQLVIPALAPPRPALQNPVENKVARPKVEVISRMPASASSRPSSGSSGKQPENRPKRKFVQRENRELITYIRNSSSPNELTFGLSTHIPSMHKRKQRSLALSPADERLFVTSALDGVVNLWQVQVRGPNASLLSTIECLSPKQRRWPEDITWHPDGDSLIAVYSADGGDSQVAILNLNLSRENKVKFLDEKPHLKGIVNNVMFMPWSDLCFATGGSDHAVILWTEKDGSWKPKTVHRNEHSSAVMGIAGLQQKKTILSVGADKRIVRYDLTAGRCDHKYLLDSKCMSVLPNPSDFNLFMVQAGTPERQLRLFDSRTRSTELHAFGWKQESSESQSALINQAWSPDGLYISSGSADPRIHIFDIRYNSSRPSQSIQAHQKRVFKADWHQSLPLLISISSDLNIGLHKIS